jgi:20S proteasome alpha/beta subunit
MHMTVCIGALCEDGKSAVVAADKMVTFGAPMMLQTEPNTFKKIYSLTPECVLLFSGSVPDGEQVMALMPAPAAKSQILKIAESAKTAYAQLKKNRTEETILRPLLGLDFAQFQALVGQSSSSQILQQVIGMIMQHNLQLDILVAGVDDSGSHLFAITHPGVLMPMDTNGFTAIGSGGLHAAVRLSLGQHTKTATLVETVYSVYEAKRAAEVAPGVGKLTDMAIIKAGKVHLGDARFFAALEGVHKERPSLTDEEKKLLEKACDECSSDKP